MGNKLYQVIDNVYSAKDQDNFFEFARNSLYRLGWADRFWQDVNGQQRSLYSHLSDDDVCNMGVLSSDIILDNRVVEFIGGRSPISPIINLADPSSCFMPHTHGQYDTFICYLNTRWNTEWAGETIIYNDTGDEAEYAVSFKPSRVLLLKDGVRHSIRPPSIAAPDFRFTFACMFEAAQ